MTKIRVLIADDHAVLRAGLQALLDAQADMEVVDQAADGYEAIRKAHETSPNIVLMDLAMPGGNAMQMIERLREECPQTRVLVLTMHDDPAYLRTALAAGASGYVVKTAMGTELLSAIRAVHQDRIFVNLHDNESPLHTVSGAEATEARARKDKSATRLSQREREVLVLLAQGNTNKQVADRLFLSVKTVETYRARITEKLGLHGRVDFFRYAVEMGLLGFAKYEGRTTKD